MHGRSAGIRRHQREKKNSGRKAAYQGKARPGGNKFTNANDNRPGTVCHGMASYFLPD